MSGSKKKRPKLWVEQSWVFLHGNAPAHRSLLATEFLPKKELFCRIILTPLILPPETSLYFLYWHLAFRVDEIQSASPTQLNDMTKNGFQKCFDDISKQR
ncbi:hypothetical protein TNCV_3379671 [Trichonephila clavipes]|nr:hypothetical protein TNCV_3379671 [Trichonephila clavipes]